MKGPVVENVVLTVHLILALLLIGVVLLQRSEGGGLGMGSGGGSGVMTGRQAANALSRLTWIFAVAFIITSLTLTIIAARNVSGSSITDQLDIGSREQGPTSGMPSLEDYTPPPGAGQPAVPGAGQPVPPPAAGDAAATTAPTAETPAAASAPATPPAAPAPAADSPAPASN